MTIVLRPGSPDFRELPWLLPLVSWPGQCAQIEDLPRGLSRHPVVFVNVNGGIYALKELPPGKAKSEFEILQRMEELRLPVVTPIGYMEAFSVSGGASVLITRYLECSLPYRSLFMSNSLVRYRESLLDAIAGLMVQIHLAGIYWGDCSLSNLLFRRDAGALRAYLVDAETAQYFPRHFPALKRYDDLEIMSESVDGELLELNSANLLANGIPLDATGAYIRLRYQRLWEEITREDIINPQENFRIQERIRALNALGFSVGDVALAETDNGNQLRLKVVVTDRNFHRDQLQMLTGLDTEEMQARKMMNEIQEHKATLSRLNNRSTSLSVAAYHWLEHIYLPVTSQLFSLANQNTTLPELYCQVLENKWYLSEKAEHDVGHQIATDDYLKKFSGMDN
jgi:hypothetical protein